MSKELERDNEHKLPYTCTPEYHREDCGECVCSTCYQQEFCDRCSTCKDQSHKKEQCSRYEGAYNY